mgnify:CR=1 FL=1|tara:strand:+ start:1468 stop:1659 length:192 start_codon:yes stop_codon:yes gene_type:complete
MTGLTEFFIWVLFAMVVAEVSHKIYHKNKERIGKTLPLGERNNTPPPLTYNLRSNPSKVNLEG